MEKFHKTVTKAKELANARGLQSKARQKAMQNYVSEKLDEELAA